MQKLSEGCRNQYGHCAGPWPCPQRCKLKIYYFRCCLLDWPKVVIWRNKYFNSWRCKWGNLRARRRRIELKDKKKTGERNVREWRSNFHAAGEVSYLIFQPDMFAVHRKIFSHGCAEVGRRLNGSSDAKQVSNVSFFSIIFQWILWSRLFEFSREIFQISEVY